MLKRYSLFYITLIFIACSAEEPNPQPAVPVKPDKPSVKTFSCDTNNSFALWERFKEMENKNQKFKVGKAKIDLQIGDLTLHSEGKFKLHHGHWTLHPDSSASATLAFDLASGFMVGVNEKERLELRHPKYLNLENYPFAVISVTNFKEDENSYQGQYFITIKDSTAKIFPVVDSVETKNGVPAYLSFTFNIDAKRWKLHDPESKNNIKGDKLSFDCIIVTNVVSR